MNREIKFRAWNKKEKYMEPVDDLQMFSNQLSIGMLSKDYFLGKDDVELMQYTGLHDENGKEIYEGDIIEFSYDVFTGNFDTKVGRGTVEFIDGAFYIKPFEIEGKKIKDIDNEEWFLIYTVNIDTLKVIGNIYDNPELLGGE